MSEPTPSSVSSTLEYYRPLPEWAPSRPKPRYWLHILLLLATCFSTLVMGARMQYNFQHNRPALSFSDDPIVDHAGRRETVPFFPAEWVRSHPERLLGGLPFMATLMLFFLAHEMGHYLYCRRYGVYATLPFFIPVPTPIGTMGAVILIRSRIRSRTALFDIGIAGPIAGFVVALAVLVGSLAWSKPISPGLGQPDYELGYPLIFELVAPFIVIGWPDSWAGCVPLKPSAPAPYCDCGLGRNAGDLAQLAAWRATRWRTYYFFDCAARPQIRVADDDSNSAAHGVLLVDGMVYMGHPVVVEQLSSSASSGVAASFRRAIMAGGICTVHACGHFYAGAAGAFFRGRSRASDAGQ